MSDANAPPALSAEALPALSAEAFVQRLRAEAAQRYHDQHFFHVAMHRGTLTREQLQAWTRNRFYYQTRIPIKDALILSKSEDPAFRRAWIRRIRDHDGHEAAAPGESPIEGGIELWLRLADGVGLDRGEVERCEGVLPGVRFACDAYVELVRERSLLEAVASSLTELVAPELMSKRIVAWEQHYPWVRSDVLAYFRSRVPRARTDSQEALAFVTAHATTRELQERCVAALVRKTEILWHLLDCVAAAYGPARPEPGSA